MKPEKKGKPKPLQGEGIAFPDLEPWPDNVKGGDLLNELTQEIRSHVVMRPEAVLTAALWILHTHTLDASETTPILGITSPVKRCGKSRLLALLSDLAYRPLVGGNVSSAAVFRIVQAYSPTLLLDELDGLKDNESLRLLLNAGVTRATAYVIRCEGDAHEPRYFRTFCAKALALIGKLPDTVADRSIPLAMERKGKEERVARPRDGHVMRELLRRKIVTWAKGAVEGLKGASPEIPQSLNDRQADHWEPLLAIAEAAGWGELARRAAVSLSIGEEDDVPGLGEQLLTDLRAVFDAREADRLTSAEVADSLVRIEGRPWANWNRGRGLNANALATLLRPFSVRPKNIRTEEAVAKGYTLADLEPVFARYLAPRSRAVAPSVAVPNGPSATLFPAPGLNCSGVAAVAPPKEVQP